MSHRRSFFAVVAAWFATRNASAQTSAPSAAKELARHALTGPQAGMEAILVEVSSAPGATSTAHRHPGFVLGYVLPTTIRKSFCILIITCGGV